MDLLPPLMSSGSILAGLDVPRSMNHSTVVDIARHARVSPATVSRVINQPERVKPERVLAVRNAMAALNYTPPPLHSRRGPKSRQLEARSIVVWFIGATNTSITDWFQEQIMELRPGFTQRRISINAFSTERPDRLPAQLEKRGIDGIILQGMEPSESVWNRLREIPNVWLMTRRSENYPGDFVEPDNIANGRLAAQYLASRGHRKVAVLTTDPRYSAIELRTRAFLDRSIELGLETRVIAPESTIRPAYLESDPPAQMIHDLVDRWSADPSRPTGIFMPADNTCESFLQSASRTGLRANRQFELILGNYSPAIYRKLSHQPAAIDIHLSTLVNRAIDHLIWRIDHFDVPGRIGTQVSPTLKPSPLVRVLPNQPPADSQRQLDPRILLSEA